MEIKHKTINYPRMSSDYCFYVQEKNQRLRLVGLGGQEASAIGAAAGAVATLTNTAGKLLAAACGTSIGLYRTSYLAGENLGLGRHPSQGSIRIQDFSLAYSILPVEER